MNVTTAETSDGSTDDSRESARGATAHIPNGLTLVGMIASVAWLVGAPWWCAILGLVLDAIDGWSARKLRACSRFGSLFDWATDITIAALVLNRLHLIGLLPILVAFQVWARERATHVSGRAGLVVIAIASEWWFT